MTLLNTGKSIPYPYTPGDEFFFEGEVECTVNVGHEDDPEIVSIGGKFWADHDVTHSIAIHLQTLEVRDWSILGRDAIDMSEWTRLYEMFRDALHEAAYEVARDAEATG